jgi:hypothetical protein
MSLVVSGKCVSSNLSALINSGSSASESYISIDSEAPQIDSLGFEGASPVSVTEVVTVSLHFSKAVQVQGFPDVLLFAGKSSNSTKRAKFAGLTNSSTLLFTVVVTEADLPSINCDSRLSRLELNGGSIAR